MDEIIKIKTKPKWSFFSSWHFHRYKQNALQLISARVRVRSTFTSVSSSKRARLMAHSVAMSERAFERSMFRKKCISSRTLCFSLDSGEHPSPPLSMWTIVSGPQCIRHAVSQFCSCSCDLQRSSLPAALYTFSMCSQDVRQCRRISMPLK